MIKLFSSFLLLLFIFFPFVYSQNSTIYMSPGSTQSQSSCGSYNNPCIGFETSITQAINLNATTIIAFSGNYYPNTTLYITKSLNISSENGQEQTFINFSPFTGFNIQFNQTNMETINFNFHGFTVSNATGTLIYATGGNISVNDITVTSNNVMGINPYIGGFVKGLIHCNSSLYITNSKFYNASLLVTMMDGIDLYIDNCDFYSVPSNATILINTLHMLGYTSISNSYFTGHVPYILDINCNGKVIFDNNIFEDCEIAETGIFLYGSEIIINNCKFSRIYANYLMMYYSPLSIHNCTFSEIHVLASLIGATDEITDTFIYVNITQSILEYIYQSDTVTSLITTSGYFYSYDSSYKNIRCNNLFPIGIRNFELDDITVNNITLYAGIQSESGSVTNSNFTNIYSRDVGGMFIVSPEGITITNSIFSNIPIPMNFGKQVEIQNSFFYEIQETIIIQSANVTIDSTRFTNCTGKDIEFSFLVHPILLALNNCTTEITNTIFENIVYPYSTIFSTNAELYVHDSQFIGGSSGIFKEFGDITINNVSFSNLQNDFFPALYASNAHLTLEYSNFTSCESTAGGAIFLDGTTNFTISHITITDCAAHTGGGMDITAQATGNVEYITISNCNAHALGGGIVLSGNSTTTFSNININKCSSMSGSGFVMQENAIATLTTFIFEQNTALASGGGLLLSDYANLQTSYGFIQSNNAGSTGAGAYIANFAVLTDLHSSFRNNYAPSQGGGIFLKDSARVYCTNATIEYNMSNSTGGGMSFSGASQGNLYNCKIAHNTASKGGGLAIHNSATPIIEDCLIHNNSATTAGGILVTDLAGPSFVNTNFTNNESKTSAGGVLATDISTTSFMTCLISYNKAGNGTGGGLLLEDFSKTHLNNSDITYNTGYSGGGVMVTSKDNIMITDCTFSNNNVSLNGGAITFDEESKALVIGGICTDNIALGRGGCISIQGIAEPNINMNITRNLAVVAGGGIYASTNAGIHIHDCFISNNLAPIGGGFFLESTVVGKLLSTTINDNLAGVGGGGFIHGSSINITNVEIIHNFAQNGAGLSIEDCSELFLFSESYIENNIAEAHGGGLYLSGNSYLNLNITGLESSINVNNITIFNNSATNGGGIYSETNAPPKFLNSIIQDNTAQWMGAGLFVSGKQSPIPWMNSCHFIGNTANWCGDTASWNYLSDTSVPYSFCTNCDYILPLIDNSIYQTKEGFSTLPFTIQVNNPSHITLDNGPINITVTIKDQLNDTIQGNILKNNIFTVKLQQSGCFMTPNNETLILDSDTGEAIFSNITFQGVQNANCLLQFSVTSNPISTSIQSFNTTIILYGCQPGYGVRETSPYDNCVISGINYVELLIVIAIFFFCILICILITFSGIYFRRKWEKQKLAEKQGLLQFDEDSIITINDIVKDPTIPNIKWKDITLDKRIGRGASGLVWSAKWHKGNGSEDIAVKELMVGVDGMAQASLKEFLCEIKIMSHLFHKKIVRFIGISVPSPKNIYLITELMHRGSLRELLDRPGNFTWDLRIKFAIDAVKGVAYLHSRGLIHRDLKTSNLLINQECVCKVADFGISTVKQETSQGARCVGTPVYMAPEVLQNNEYSKQGDVYSFGIILYELYTKKYPYSEPEYANMNISNLTYKIAYKGIRPDCSEINNVVRQLIYDCLNEDPILRPNFSEILSRLKRIKKMKLVLDNDDIVCSSQSLKNFSNERISGDLPLLLTNSDGSDNISRYGSIGIDPDIQDRMQSIN